MQALASAARIIRGNVGTEVITVDQGDWDMHVDLGNLASGQMIGNADGPRDRRSRRSSTTSGDQADKVTLVTISEFGRRVLENGNRGLDHGWGNVMFVAGAGVQGRQGLPQPAAKWKSFNDDLEADLVVTTDYRHVLAEIVKARFAGAPASRRCSPASARTRRSGFMA